MNDWPVGAERSLAGPYVVFSPCFDLEAKTIIKKKQHSKWPQQHPCCRKIRPLPSAVRISLGDYIFSLHGPDLSADMIA